MKAIKEYDCEDCEYKEVTYREYDTGYEEWECTLQGMNCCINACPKDNKIIKMEE